MKHAASCLELPIDAPVHIFGTGIGGDIVHTELLRFGIPLRGFIDDTKSGLFQGKPILSTAMFSGQAADGAAVVLIASQHWRAIGRQLDQRRCVPLDASPMLRAAQRRRMRGEAAAPTAQEQSLYRQIDAMARLLPVPTPYVILGSGAEAMRLRQRMDNHPTLYLAGYVDATPPGFIDWIDVCPLDVFLAEEEPRTAPLILSASAHHRHLAASLRDHGFDRLVELQHAPKATTP